MGTLDAPLDPGTMERWRFSPPTVLRFTVTGASGATIWGDGIYTDDSPIGVAAVHAGLVSPGETAVLLVETHGEQQSFGAATRNGVSSSSYGYHPGSYRFPEASEVTGLVLEGFMTRLRGGPRGGSEHAVVFDAVALDEDGPGLAWLDSDEISDHSGPIALEPVAIALSESIRERFKFLFRLTGPASVSGLA